jgi:rare lipoprotein A
VLTSESEAGLRNRLLGKRAARIVLQTLGGVALLFTARGCVTHMPPASSASAAAVTIKRPVQVGTASWYGPRFQGKKTANGETFNMHSMTAAHRTLPLGTRVRVTNLRTGKQVKVRINDRGPYAKGRKIDLSRAAARKLGIVKKGVAKVKIAIVPTPTRTASGH